MFDKLNTLTLEIAGLHLNLVFYQAKLVFTQNKLTREIKQYYSSFVTQTSRKPNYKIELKEKYYRLISLNRDKTKSYSLIAKTIKPKIIEISYEISIFHFQKILYQVLNYLLFKKQGIMLHCSAVAKEGQAYIFLGKSGAGKSTITRLLKNKYQQIGEDTGIIRKIGNQFYFFQTPFIEAEPPYKKTRDCYHIARLYILKKSKTFKLKENKTSEQTIQFLLEETITEKQYLNKQAKLVTELYAKHKPYILYFDKRSRELIKLLENNSPE